MRNSEPIGNKQITTWHIWREAEKRKVPVKVSIFTTPDHEDRTNADRKVYFAADRRSAEGTDHV